MIEVAAFTNQGLVRRKNEDTMLVSNWISPAAMSEPYVFNVDTESQPLLLLVADGMGGHAAGEVASKYIVEAISERFHERKLETLASDLNDVNKKLGLLSITDPKLTGLGSTVVGAIFEGRNLKVFNIGDSRAYILGSAALQVSTDDSLLDKGQVKGAPNKRVSHAVTQCFGGYSIGKTISPHIWSEELNADGTLLLCSDGLTDLVPDTQLQIDENISLAENISRLMDQALKAGGSDNISILLARYR